MDSQKTWRDNITLFFSQSNQRIEFSNTLFPTQCIPIWVVVRMQCTIHEKYNTKPIGLRSANKVTLHPPTHFLLTNNACKVEWVWVMWWFKKTWRAKNKQINVEETNKETKRFLLPGFTISITNYDKNRIIILTLIILNSLKKISINDLWHQHYARFSTCYT